MRSALVVLSSMLLASVVVVSASATRAEAPVTLVL